MLILFLNQDIYNIIAVQFYSASKMHFFRNQYRKPRLLLLWQKKRKYSTELFRAVFEIVSATYRNQPKLFQIPQIFPQDTAAYIYIYIISVIISITSLYVVRIYIGLYTPDFNHFIST